MSWMSLDEAIDYERRHIGTEPNTDDVPHHVQLFEWLRAARGAYAASLWSARKIRELQGEVDVCKRENADLRESVRRLRMKHEEERDG